jgi:hypothetical protein
VINWQKAYFKTFSDSFSLSDELPVDGCCVLPHLTFCICKALASLSSFEAIELLNDRLRFVERRFVVFEGVLITDGLCQEDNDVTG